MRNSTLVFLVKRNTSKNIENICLAMKKRGFGAGRYNGTGGKVEEETIEEAAIRETREEIGVQVENLVKVAKLEFRFPHNPAWDQIVHVFLSEIWDGELTESEEMKPEWFSVSKIPYDTMWPDDKFWLPKVIAGDLIKGSFVFGENDIVVQQEVDVVSMFREA